MKVIDGGVTAPKGFQAAGKHIGIKKVKKDISLLFSEKPAVAAGMFTKNMVRAAPVIWNEARLKGNCLIRGVITVSGNANACTGEKGLKDNEAMAEYYAEALQVTKNEILTAATGIIGLEMPMKTIQQGVKETTPLLARSREGARNAASGIITTDTFLKEMAVELNIAGKKVRIGAMAKGSGMVHPNMATVLAFITTDMVISQRLLQKALQEAVEETYNMISVDGAMSTNDMALLLANGMACNEEIDEYSEFYDDFKKALLFVNRKLAMDVVRDGEGASKFISFEVVGAKTREDARLLAKAVATNNLVKTAMYGEDANWGRIAAAMGASGAYFDPAGLGICFESEEGNIILMRHGQPTDFDEDKAAAILHHRDLTVLIELKDGVEAATAWGCDLGHEYVRINGEYRSRG